METILCKQKLVNNHSIPSKKQPTNHNIFSKISRASTALQSQLFLKNIKNFLCKQKLVNNCSIPSTHARKKKLPIFLINTLLLHIPLLALTGRQKDRQRDKYTRCAWAGGTFFPVVLLCQFFGFWQKIGFGVTYLRIQSTIQLWSCVGFLVLEGNSFWCYIRTQCTIHLCGCVSFFVVAGNSVAAGNSSQNENTFGFPMSSFYKKNLIGLLYYDPIANVCIL